MNYMDWISGLRCVGISLLPLPLHMQGCYVLAGLTRYNTVPFVTTLQYGSAQQNEKHAIMLFFTKQVLSLERYDQLN